MCTTELSVFLVFKRLMYDHQKYSTVLHYVDTLKDEKQRSGNAQVLLKGSLT